MQIRKRIRTAASRALAAIPIGLALKVGGFLCLGEPTGGTMGSEVDRLVTDPFAASRTPVSAGPVIPTPSGPEGRDDRAVFEN